MKINKLDGKRALVTGARTGIGAAIAEALADAGASVIVSGRTQGDCADVVDAITQSGGVAKDIALDLANIDAIAPTIETIIGTFDGLDIIVNNGAVIAPQAPFGKIDANAFDRACQINLTAPMAIVNAAWTALGDGGRVLNILSGAAVKPMEGWVAYCSSKAGLHMLTQQIDLEGAPLGIRAYGLAPGVVDTNMQAHIRHAKTNRISEIPQTSLDSPQWAATAVQYMVSGVADDLAGQMIDIRSPEFRKRAGLPDIEN